MTDTTNSTNQIPKIAPWRISVFVATALAIFLVFVWRLFSLQILGFNEWITQANINRTNEISIPTQRGVIFDRNGIILARNVAAYNVIITPAYLPDDDGDIHEIFRELSILTGVPLNKGSIDDPLIPCGDNMGISQLAEKQNSYAPFQPVLIKCDVERQLALQIMGKAVDWPGVGVEIEPIRDYPTGETTATMIGFLGPIPETQEEELRALGFVPRRDKIGYAGLEVFYEELLRGTPGRQVVEVDVAGQVLRDLEAPIAPQPGLNLVLTIDTRLQQAADQIMKYEIETWTTYFGYLRISSGVAIAMNPRTGEILAMVSYPTYQNNRLARFIPAYYYEQLISDATQPLLNHAVGAELPAGSVFKLVTSVGALNEGVVTPTQIIQTPGQITIQERYFEGDQGKPRPFVDWKAEGFGQLDFLGGISNSSNVYFYKLGGGYPGEIPDGGLGICRIGTYARALGYGAELGIELPDEANGLIPNPTWKRINLGENWSTGDTYISAVGQGLVISTPLQVLMSAAVVANNGVLVRPTLVREVVDGEGNVIQAVVDENGNPIPNAVIDDFGNITNIVLEQGSRRVEIEVNVRGEVLSVAVEGRRGVVGVIMDNDDRILNYVTDDFRNIKQISRDTRGRITEIELAANSSRVDIILNNDGKVSSVAMQDEKNVVALLLDEETQFVVGLIEGERNHGDLYVSSPFYPDVKWDLTKDPLIQQFEDPGGIGSCKPTGDYTTVQSWVFKKIQEGMRLVVTHGTLNSDDTQFSVPAAGKTGTAEYCDAVALSNNRCNFGNWPTHSWTVAYAPFENPEIVVVAFMYNGGEGASVAGPVVRKIVDAYFELRAIDAALGNP